jgi:hypothetical protein
LRRAGASVELDLVDGADHMWQGAADPENAIFTRALDFARRVAA